MFDAVTRRRFTVNCGLAPLAALAACTTAPRLPAGAAAALAPRGRLRACITLGNPIADLLATKSVQALRDQVAATTAMATQASSGTG